MDTGNLKKLNKFHVVFLSQNVIIGIGLFTLSNEISMVGYNQWLIPIMLGVLANITLIPIVLLCKKFPDDSLFKINEKILGKLLGKMANGVLFLYGLMGAAIIIRGYSRIVQSVVLPGFQVLPLTVSLFFVMSCIVAGGIKSVARFCIFSFFMTGWMVIFLQWPLQAGNWLHAVPTFEVSYTDWLEALHEGALSMFGYGLLMFYYPYIQNQKKVFLHTSIGIWLAVLFYLIVSIAAVVYFSAWQLDNLLFPVLNLFQAIKLTFVERIENFGTTLWVFLVLSTSSAYLWVAKKGMDALTNKHKDRVWHISVVAFLSWLLVSGPIPMDIQVIIFDEWSVFYGYGLLLYPIFLLVINYIKRKLTKKEPKEQEVST